MNNIELELRAEVTLDQFNRLLENLRKTYKELSRSKRLSVMFIGSIDDRGYDVRVRIDSDKKAEFVIKRGDFHSHDRVEAAQLISKDQFLGLIKILSLFDFKSKVTERENFVFDLGDEVYLTLVRAGEISYVEIEKMSNQSNLEKNRDQLLKLINHFNLRLIKDDVEFNNLCDRLSELSDWWFSGKNEDYVKIENLLNKY